MKKGFAILLVMFISISSAESALAQENEDDGTLNLDTENIKTKGEDYSSLTDMNGLNLFTNDMRSILDIERKMESSENDKIRKVLFTSRFSDIEENKDDRDMIFTKAVSFEKTAVSKQAEVPLSSFFIAGTMLLSVAVFILTRRKYKKEVEKIEAESNIYE